MPDIVPVESIQLLGGERKLQGPAYELRGLFTAQKSVENKVNSAIHTIVSEELVAGRDNCPKEVCNLVKSWDIDTEGRLDQLVFYCKDRDAHCGEIALKAAAACMERVTSLSDAIISVIEPPAPELPL